MSDIQPMTLPQKLQALVRMAEQGREADVYSGLEWLLRSRQWPAWLQEVAANVDGAASVPLDRPTNLQEAA